MRVSDKKYLRVWYQRKWLWVFHCGLTGNDSADALKGIDTHTKGNGKRLPCNAHCDRGGQVWRNRGKKCVCVSVWVEWQCLVFDEGVSIRLVEEYVTWVSFVSEFQIRTVFLVELQLSNTHCQHNDNPQTQRDHCNGTGQAQETQCADEWKGSQCGYERSNDREMSISTWQNEELL